MFVRLLNQMIVLMLWVFIFLSVAHCARRDAAGLQLEAQRTSYHCVPLAPIYVKTIKDDCLCCSQDMSILEKNSWSTEIDKILTSCLRVKTDDLDLDPNGPKIKTKKGCQRVCDLQAFCPQEQAKYRYDLFSTSGHCLGENLRKKKSGGFVHKALKILGSDGRCQEDSVYEYVKTTQQTLTDQFMKTVKDTPSCMMVEPLPELVQPGDCVCCTADSPPNWRSWSAIKNDILKHCVLGFKSIADGVLDKEDCASYCKSAVEWPESPTCSSNLRKSYYISIFSEKPHCLALNKRAGGSIGKAFNKFAKSVGSVGNCVPDALFLTSLSDTKGKIKQIKKEMGGYGFSKGGSYGGSKRSKPKTDEKTRLKAEEANIDWSKGLTRITRYGKISDERTFPFVNPRTYKITQRVDGQYRLASPFEHICGGARQERDIDEGHDGPTQYISFSNMGQFEHIVGNCKQPFDVGQRRVKTSEKYVNKLGGLTFDLSKWDTAYKWCYEGGCVTTNQGEQLCFQGSRDIDPWPYKCAQRAYQIEIRQRYGAPENSWWNEANRKLIAESCVVWALRAREVLVLPDPSKIQKGYRNNGVKVLTDRQPADHLCVAGFEDRCVDFHEHNNSLCCCNDKNPDGSAACWADICNMPR